MGLGTISSKEMSPTLRVPFQEKTSPKTELLELLEVPIKKSSDEQETTREIAWKML